MSQKATISSEYWWRVVLFAAVFLGLGLWSLYDGFIGWPRKKFIAEEFIRFKDEGRIEQWPDHAKEQGWPIEDPGKPKTDAEINLQFLMAAATLPLGLVFGVGLLRSRSKWLMIEDGAIVSSWGAKVTMNSVTQLDKRRWKNKGIAVVQYEDAGRKRRLVLDDWKYTRSLITEMVEMVEQHIGPDKIIEPPTAPQATQPDTTKTSEAAQPNDQQKQGD